MPLIQLAATSQCCAAGSRGAPTGSRHPTRGTRPLPLLLWARQPVCAQRPDQPRCVRRVLLRTTARAITRGLRLGLPDIAVGLRIGLMALAHGPGTVRAVTEPTPHPSQQTPRPLYSCVQLASYLQRLADEGEPSALPEQIMWQPVVPLSSDSMQQKPDA